MNVACPKCGSNDVQSAVMIVATGTTTGESRSQGSGIGATLDGDIGLGLYSGSSTNTSKTALAQRYSFESSGPVMLLGCSHWALGIICIIALLVGLASDDSDSELKVLCSLVFFFSSFGTLLLWGLKRKRLLKEEHAHKETIDRLWVCLRCGCEFFP